jgi:hypothetical protein
MENRSLRIEIVKRADGAGLLRCYRADGSVTWQKQPERHAVHFTHHDDICTTIVPHVMHYVPNVSPEAVGAATPAPDELRYFCEHGHYRNNPDPFVIFHGAHGYMIQFLGVTERDAIHKEYEGMLERLCKIKKVWCLPQ